MKIVKYTKQYEVKSHEVDCHGFLRLLSLMNTLQDIAVENADVLGVGLDICRQHGLAWVGANYMVQITRLPRQHEHFTIETWPAVQKVCSAIRDFAVKDESGAVIIKASSQWVLIDMAKRRPVPVKKYFAGYETLAERMIDTDFPKMAEIAADGATRTTFKVRFDDIDVNKHVNNAVYPLWASEGVDSAFRFEHTPAEIELSYKKEALYGEQVEVLTVQNGNESFHSIQDKNSGAELALCRILWQKI